jgi:hypothetical protein
MISPLWKQTIQEKYNVVVYPFAFHIAVQPPFKPLWSRLLLYELEPSQASFPLCFKSLLMTLLPASVVVSLFVWRLPFDLTSKAGPASSYATSGIALRVTGVHKPPHHDKVETPTRRFVNICVKNQQLHQLFIQFINYGWYLLHVSALHCHPQGAFLVLSERCSIEEQSIEYCGWAWCV